MTHTHAHIHTYNYKYTQTYCGCLGGQTLEWNWLRSLCAAPTQMNFTHFLFECNVAGDGSASSPLPSLTLASRPLAQRGHLLCPFSGPAAVHVKSPAKEFISVQRRRWSSLPHGYTFSPISFFSFLLFLFPFFSPFSFSPAPTSTREFFTHWYNDCSCRGECCCCPSHKCCCCTPYCCCCCCCCSHGFTLSFGTHTHTHTQPRTRNWSTLRHLHSFIKICALLAFIKWISMCLHFASLPPFPIPTVPPPLPRPLPHSPQQEVFSACNQKWLQSCHIQITRRLPMQLDTIHLPLSAFPWLSVSLYVSVPFYISIYSLSFN